MNTKVKKDEVQTVRGHIRPAIDDDIPIIEAWLNHLPRNAESMAVNWKVTLGVYRKQGILVFEEFKSKAPIAYAWGSLNSRDSLMEVRHDYRNLGIGRLLANKLIESSIAAGEPLLLIECAPPSSSAFWKQLDFEIEEEYGHTYAKNILKIPRQLPLKGRHIDVVIRFYPVEATYGIQGILPLSEHKPQAVCDSEGTVSLGEKIASFEPGPYSNRGELVVEIYVAGEQIYFDKAKYDEAKKLGVMKCENGYAIERIRLPEASSRWHAVHVSGSTSELSRSGTIFYPSFANNKNRRENG